MPEVLGRRLAVFLSKHGHVHSTSPPTNQELLKRALRPGDVLLVEGTSIIATAIKYLSQSTWSHAALYVGSALTGADSPESSHMLIEADLLEGVTVIGLQKYAGFHCRICRPVGLSVAEVQAVLSHAIGRRGNTYDLRNVVDLARYLLPTLPVPTAWRRRMIALGSGDPTRAICSGLIAQAFQSIGYPVLPDVATLRTTSDDCPDCIQEILRVRHYSLFVPRDFDVSPYFEVVKPTLIANFNHHALNWANGDNNP
jgi:hypothetical protein